MEGLKNKVVLITGASSGIGRATSIQFAKLGCKLSLVARNLDWLKAVAQECRSSGASGVTINCHDLSTESGCLGAVEDTLRYFGELDVLVNSAGILMSGSTLNLSLEDYDKCMNINLRSPFLLMQKSLPHLKKNKGSIVNVSSVTGLRAFPNVVAYNMSKAALDQLTRTCALEVASDGVRVNSVNPGVVVTECHKRSGMTELEYLAFLEHSKTTHAMGRVASADEVASTIVFLASQSASFITGQTLAVDGGRSVMCPR